MKYQFTTNGPILQYTRHAIRYLLILVYTKKKTKTFFIFLAVAELTRFSNLGLGNLKILACSKNLDKTFRGAFYDCELHFDYLSKPFLTLV